jgi:hypothetical protein
MIDERFWALLSLLRAAGCISLAEVAVGIVLVDRKAGV